MKNTNHWFATVANAIGRWMGTPLAFIVSCGICLLWAISGPLFNYSDTWQLVINTGTTVLTFLLIFIIQNTQNRNASALHVKLDEILRAIPEARTSLATDALEDQPEDIIQKEREKVIELANQNPPSPEERERKANGNSEPKDSTI